MGFLIDAATQAAPIFQGIGDTRVAHNLAEIIVRTYNSAGPYAGLSLMVWILKREVRAFGGCLGTYRR
jgi:hypothetical protein